MVEQLVQNVWPQCSQSRVQHAPITRSQCAHSERSPIAISRFCNPPSQTAQLIIAGFGASAVAMARSCRLCFFIRAFVAAADIMRLCAHEQ